MCCVGTAARRTSWRRSRPGTRTPCWRPRRAAARAAPGSARRSPGTLPAAAGTPPVQQGKPWRSVLLQPLRQCHRQGLHLAARACSLVWGNAGPTRAPRSLPCKPGAGARSKPCPCTVGSTCTIGSAQTAESGLCKSCVAYGQACRPRYAPANTKAACALHENLTLDVEGYYRIGALADGEDVVLRARAHKHRRAALRGDRQDAAGRVGHHAAEQRAIRQACRAHSATLGGFLGFFNELPIRSVLILPHHTPPRKLTLWEPHCK